jgi:hypothetical protein
LVALAGALLSEQRATGLFNVRCVSPSSSRSNNTCIAWYLLARRSHWPRARRDGCGTCACGLLQALPTTTSATPSRLTCTWLFQHAELQQRKTEASRRCVVPRCGTTAGVVGGWVGQAGDRPACVHHRHRRSPCSSCHIVALTRRCATAVA